MHQREPENANHTFKIFRIFTQRKPSTPAPRTAQRKVQRLGAADGSVASRRKTFAATLPPLEARRQEWADAAPVAGLPSV